MMITLLPGLRVSVRHVNHTSETTKSRNHREKEKNQRFALQELLKQFLAMSRYITAISYHLKTNCGKAIAIVSSWQNPQYGGCKI
jgi:molecular chaperone GrpE (heat shock protein)